LKGEAEAAAFRLAAWPPWPRESARKKATMTLA
jgi:hypothetical protein